MMKVLPQTTSKYGSQKAITFSVTGVLRNDKDKEEAYPLRELATVFQAKFQRLRRTFLDKLSTISGMMGCVTGIRSKVIKLAGPTISSE